MNLTFVGRSESWRAAVVGPLIVTIWSKTGTVADFDEMERVLARQIAYHGKIVSLSIIDALDLRPPPEVRARIAKLGQMTDPSVSSSGVVLRTEGLVSVIVYGIMNAFILASANANPTHVTRDLAGALQWLHLREPRLQELGALSELRSAVEQYLTGRLRAA